MHRILLILIVLLSGIQRMSAQYYRINHDHWMEKATEVSIPNRRKEAEKRDNTPGNMTEPTPSPGIKKEDVEP